MTKPMIGFHLDAGSAANFTGIGDWMRALDSAGVPFFLKSADTAGPLYEAQELRKSSGVPHVLVYRKSGDGWDVPDYSLPPQAAADSHWARHVDEWPPELDPEIVWMENINEVDKNRADWVGEFCYYSGILAVTTNHRWCGPGWSSGEPESEHWWTDGMQRFIKFASKWRNWVGVAVHEYSYTIDTLMGTFPWLIGRFLEVDSVCQSLAIPLPNIMVTEFGWCYDDIPDRDTAMAHIAEVAALYAEYGVKGAAIWNLGGNSKGLANSTNGLMEPLRDFILTTEYPEPEPEPPDPEPEPEPEPERVAVAKITLFDDGTGTWEKIE